MKLITCLNIFIGGLLLAAVILLSGCSNDDGTAAADDGAIRFKTDVWQVMEGTRAAATFDDDDDLQTAGTFSCAAYQSGTATAYISPWASVEYVSATTFWEFSGGKRYWPAEGSLDFFAYMPATLPSYITAVTYAVTAGSSPIPAPQLTCTNLPVTEAGQEGLQEFIYALRTGQNKAGQGASGVALTFKHPFARINLQWSAADHTGITINSITFKNIKNNGTCTIDGSTGNPSWETSGSAADFTAAAMGGPFLVVPQTFTGGNVTIEVNATKEGDTETFTATVATAWAAGYSYTYSFTLNFKAKELIIDTTKYTEQW